MHFPIVQQYKTDILNENPENEIKKEPKEIPVNTGNWVIVPRHAPFFVNSLVLYSKNGARLIPDKDYKIFRLMSRLTAECGQPVACFIEITNKDLDMVLTDYDTLGEFSLIDNTFLQLVAAAVNDDRPVWWDNLDNKPTVFPPTLHQHSLLTDITSFQDTIDLLNDLIRAIKVKGVTESEIQLQHYIDLVRHYMGVYGGMLSRFLSDHKGSYNEHGLTIDQVGLPNADNFGTVYGSDVLQPLTDKHITPTGLKTIIEAYGFNSSEFLEANVLPISRYGNTNFIPPAIDGSYEALGGTYEACGICLETDGTLVYIANRFDGRIRGLYYTTVIDWETAEYKSSFTAARYTHPFFVQHNSVVDRIAAGSGNEVILVAASNTARAYIGKTNGTFDPAKHTYSAFNLGPALATIHGTSNTDVSSYIARMSIARMGEWVYIFYAHNAISNGVGGPGRLGNCYRSIFRFRYDDINGDTVTPTLVNTSYRDLDGVQWNNVDRWRWCTPISANANSLSRYIHTFSPPVSVWAGAYRTQETLVVPHRDKPGIFVIKFRSWYWVGTDITGADVSIEATYEFNPANNVFTFLHGTEPTVVNTNGVFELPWSRQSNASRYFLAYFDSQGALILPNGMMTCLMALDFNGYPRAISFERHPKNRSAFETITDVLYKRGSPVLHDFPEPIRSPVASSSNPCCFLFDKEGSYYIAGSQENANKTGLFFKKVSGRFQQRPGVTNLVYPNLLSQPLTFDIRKVNLPSLIGGSWCSTSTAELATYGVDVGDMSFCCAAQNKSVSLRAVGNAAPINGLSNVDHGDDIKLISRFNRVIQPDGSINIVPTEEITYPKAIIDSLKQQVPNQAIMNASSAVNVVISDPNGKLTDTFGWLPVIATIQYYGGRALYATSFVLAPTYVTTGNQKRVTGVSVRAINHGVLAQQATDGNSYFNDRLIDPHTRCLYYKTGNSVRALLVTGITTSVIGNSVGSTIDTTHTVSSQTSSIAGLGSYALGENLVDIAPNAGILRGVRQGSSTGGAGTIYPSAQGNFLLGSLYPETGWIIFFINRQEVVFSAKQYILPAGTIDLRDIDPSPANKTFYIYARLMDGEANYVVTQEKLMESAYNLWIGTVKTNLQQIQTIERFNVFTVNGHRVSETKRGNSIPASSGVLRTEGQLPWLKRSELLP